MVVEKNPLEEVKKKLEKRFGEGIISALHDITMRIPAWATGIVSYDKISGVGGFPAGRIIEMFGPEQSGKTTMGYNVSAGVQKAGKRVLFLDYEHTFDPKYASDLGVKFADDLWTFAQPKSLEEGMTIAREFLRDKALNLGLIIVDSLAAMAPEAELEEDLTYVRMGLQSLLMGQTLKHIKHLLTQRATTLIFMNQMRDKMGTYMAGGRTTPGGNAPKHYATVRLEFTRLKLLQDAASRESMPTDFISELQRDPENIKAFGSRVRLKIVKSKVSVPYRETEVNLVFGIGFDKIRDAYDYAESHGLFVKERGQYHLVVTKGREDFKIVFRTLEEFREAVISENMYEYVYKKLMAL